jgi:hypothetical protein
MIRGTGAHVDGIEDAQCRICVVQAILQLAVDRLELIEEATNATHAVHLAGEILEDIYKQLQSVLEPEQAWHEVMPYRWGSAH